MKRGRPGFLLPTSTLILLLLCAAGVLVFALFVILPARQLEAEIEADIAVLKARLEEQRVLHPVFLNLLEKSKAPADPRLNTAARVRLARGEIAALPRTLAEIAAAHGLTVREIAPDVNTLTDASNRFLVRVRLSGRFLDFRGFLLAAASLGYFEGFEEIEVRAAEGGEELNINMWLARE